MYNDLHKSVLLKELSTSIKIFDGKKNIIVDATLWLAGHAKEIINRLNPWDIFIWFDADIENLNLARKRLEDVNPEIKIILINSNFLNLKNELEKRWIEKITWIYYDLGISSMHIDSWDRGFSFKLDGPLDMRFDKSKWKTASGIVNSYKKEDLRKIFLEYWEEPFCNKIAEEIVKARKIKKFETTKELSDLIWKVSKFQKSKNRIFQALRIEVNNELDNIKISLQDAINLLDEQWIIFVISFHSLEDRIVKNLFKKETKDCICSDLICSCGHKKTLKKLNKKPILPSPQEIEENPRSRSAKARMAEKLA